MYFRLLTKVLATLMVIMPSSFWGNNVGMPRYVVAEPAKTIEKPVTVQLAETPATEPVVKPAIIQTEAPAVTVAKPITKPTVSTAVKSEKKPAPTVQPCTGDWGRLYLDTAPGRAICIFITNDLNVDASNKIALYSGKFNKNQGLPSSGSSSFLFGHNSRQVFGEIGHVKSFKIVTNDGRTFQYQIKIQEVVCDYTNAAYPCANYSEPVLDMRDPLAAERKLGRIGVAIMTCAGKSIGGGDATHRRIAYAVPV